MSLNIPTGLLAAGKERNTVLTSTVIREDFTKYMMTTNEEKCQGTRNVKYNYISFYVWHVHITSMLPSRCGTAPILMITGCSEPERPRYKNICGRGAAYQVETRASGLSRNSLIFCQSLSVAAIRRWKDPYERAGRWKRFDPVSSIELCSLDRNTCPAFLG